MSKLSKVQFKAHEEAEALLLKDALTIDERQFVLENWDPSAKHVNSAAGAFFTPLGLAFDLVTMAGHPEAPMRVLDLCAGIGALSFAIAYPGHREPPEIVCVEKNPDYLRVGQKVVPAARWIEGDVLDVPGMDLGRFDLVVSNPPFGRIKREGGKTAPGYTGAAFEFHVIDIASGLCDFSMFILPQMSAGFKYSGRQFYERDTTGTAFEFQKSHGLHFEACSIDAEVYRREWKGVAPAVEVVSIQPAEDLEAVQKPAPVTTAPQPEPEQLPLFDGAA